MLEIALGIGVCFVIAKVAASEEMSAIIWFVVAFAICFLCLLIPLPFLRMGIAGGLGFAALTAYKAVAGK